MIEEEGLIENAAQRGQELMARLQQIQERSRFLGDVRGQGLMIGMEMVSDRKSKEPAPAIAREIRAALRERGILVGVGGLFGNVVRIQPPLSITADECDQLADCLEHIL